MVGRPTGALFFMVPGQQDSARFLFHSPKDSFPQEPDTVLLGNFASGTPIVFMYTIIGGPDGGWKNKRLFTGQCRPGSDQYVSEMAGRFGNRAAIVGRIDDQRHVVGFNIMQWSDFSQITFTVSGVQILR